MGLISKQDFAKMAGVGKSTVSKLISRGAISDVGGKIDLECDKVKTYLDFRRQKSAASGKASKRKPAKPKKKTVRSDAAGMASDALGREVDDDELKSNALKKVELEVKKLGEQARNLELKNAKEEHRLYSAKAVKEGVIDTIETCFQRMLNDGSKTIAAKLHPMILGGGTVEEAAIEIRKRQTAFIRVAKSAMNKAITDIETDAHAS